MRDDRVALGSALVDAIAGEKRLRREALREDALAQKWADRVAFAEGRGLADLAAAAGARRERHLATADLLRRRAGELRLEVERLRVERRRLEVERLRSHLRPSREGGPDPPLVDELAARFADLEVEDELIRLRRQRASPPPNDSFRLAPEPS